MKKYLLIIATLVALPLASFAAYDDVQIASNETAIISLNGVDLVVSSGTSAVFESIEVNNGSFTVTMPVSSYLRLTLSSRKTVSVSNKGTVELTEACSDCESSFKLESPTEGST